MECLSNIWAENSLFVVWTKVIVCENWDLEAVLVQKKETQVECDHLDVGESDNICYF